MRQRGQRLRGLRVLDCRVERSWLGSEKGPVALVRRVLHVGTLPDDLSFRTALEVLEAVVFQLLVNPLVVQHVEQIEDDPWCLARGAVDYFLELESEGLNVDRLVL